MTALAALQSWVSQLFVKPPIPLEYMRAGPGENTDNPLMLQFFTWDCLHGSLTWWQHFEAEIPRLAEMGFTQVWLPPPNKAAKPTGRGYDAYDLWDLGEFNQKGTVPTRWGTREQYLSACKTAKEHGLDILIDAVLNHKLGADRTEAVQAIPSNPQNRLKDIGPAREIQAWTSFEYPGRGDQYSKFRWNQEHFTGVDWDHKTREKAIFRLVGPGHKGWSRNVDTELGNYDFLLGVDIDHRHPTVQEDLYAWGAWILETTGATGFRLDAIKHIDRKFMLKWIKETRQRSGLKDMFVVSEYWSGNLKAMLPYIRAFQGESAFFDVPLHMNFNQASRERTRYDLRKIWNNTVVNLKPNSAVTFVDNHDTVEGQSLESWVDTNFKLQAYAIILLRGYGHPCVFYGDLYPNKEGYDASIARGLERLISARKKFAYGSTQDYLAEKNCIGFVRGGDVKHRGCAVLLSNKEDNRSSSFLHEVRMNVGVNKAGAVYESFMTDGGSVEIDQGGWGVFSCFAGGVQVWVEKET